MWPKRILFPIIILSLLLAGCPAAKQSSAASESNMSPSRVVQIQDDGETSGLRLRLSAGTEPQATPVVVPSAVVTSLVQSASQAVLARLPALQAGGEDQQPFAYPKGSLPPPRPGATVELAFPPAEAGPTPQVVGARPVEVVRYQPEGSVPLAPYLSITFNQPMVALTSHDDLAATAPPVQLSPEVAGKWRWVGTQTLMFEPEYRFPMATHYTATVPAGTTSAGGGKLASVVTWHFTTPPPGVKSAYPSGGPQGLEPVMFVAFDQKIEPDAVLSAIKLSAGSKSYRLRLVTADEVKADEAVRRAAEAAAEGTWLAFRTTEPFPTNTTVNVSVGPGVPSTEGPLKSTQAHNFSFATYGPLRVVEQRCGWDNQCPPSSPWTVRFSNPLDRAAFTSTLISVTPEVPGLNIQLYGETLSIQGRTQGQTTYQVTLPAALRDQFGQTLGRDQTLTFKTTSAPAAIWAPGSNFVVLDPSGKPNYSVFSVNYDRLHVQLYSVSPTDWAAFQTFQQAAARSERPGTPPGRKVFDQSLTVQAKTDEMVETAVDLSSALNAGLGHVIVVIEPEGARGLAQQRGRVPVMYAWVQSTRIGLDAAVDATDMLAWANSLADGKPLAGVELSLDGKNARTDAGGLATLQLPPGGPAALLVGRLGADTAILPANTGYWGGGGWQLRPVRDSLRWLVYDDRGMYRPGEEVHFKGWIRRVGAGKAGDVGAITNGGQLNYRVMDPQGNQVGQGEVKVNALGGFDAAFTLPEAMNLGYAQLFMTFTGAGDVDGTEYSHPLQVQEFRRPEFEVSAKTDEGPYIVGGQALVTAEAKYYAGGGLANAQVTWNVRSRPGQFSPPNWDDFTFGLWTPWWREMPGEGRGGPEKVETFTGQTDAAGKHVLRIDFESVDPPQATSVTAETSIMDVNRQAWAASATLLVHPANVYVGLRSDRYFVQREEPLRIDVIVADLDGKAVVGTTVNVRAARLEWTYRGDTWQETEANVQPCTVQSSAQPVRCVFETPEGGTYRITATVKDAQGRPNQTQITRWVSGGTRPPARNVEQEEVTLIPDRKTYAPGETAEILVQAPFAPAEGVVTLRRSGIVSSQRFTMSGPSYTIKVPIEEAYIPNVHVQVDLTGAASRLDDKGNVDPSLPQRPAFATGQLNLEIPPLKRALVLQVTPREQTMAPGSKTTLDLVLKDADGKPVQGGEVAVVVADEAVLALTGYKLPDPLAVFYQLRSPDTQDHHLRSSIVLANPEELQNAQRQDGFGGGGAVPAAPQATMAAGAPREAPMAMAKAEAAYDTASQAAPLTTRTDFNALALFAPALVTDAEGRTQVEVTLPDNLTRYRIMAIAVAGARQFGAGESTLTARLPLMVRASPPRFLNFGDRFELPVVIQNQTDQALAVDVVVRASNLLLTAGEGRRVNVPANDRVEVRFPATTDQPGIARFQVGAVSGQMADASQLQFPVWTPATTEAFATYGQLDQGAVAQPLIAPSNVYTQFGGLEISTSSTALQALTDAVLYLVSYPYECTEQMASRVLAVAALRDVLTAFEAEGLPSPEEIQATVESDIERLSGLQNGDGGWPIWQRGNESWPYYSIHVAHALQRARDKDFRVPDDTMERAKAHLREIERYIPSWYGASARQSLIAYSLYVRNLMGDRDTVRARRLISEAGLDKLPTESVGWLLSVLSGDPASTAEVNNIRRYLNNRVTETAGAASFATAYGEDAYLLLHSNRRTDAVILDALIADQPQSDLIPKVVQGLLGHRTKGRWNNTQENTFVLLALDRYFNTFEAETPDFVARLWLGDQYAGETRFQGRSTDRQQVNIPMALVAQGAGQQNLIVSKEGAGRLYYRLGLSYAPKSLDLKPAEHGFTVQRSYEAVDDPKDVSRDPDGAWRVKASALVRVQVTMVAQARRYHVALTDPLPAGLEAVNPALAVAGALPPNQDPRAASMRNRWWWGPWYQYQNLRDQRAEAFTSLLWEGVYTYTYVARATTPGTFVVPPAKAEEMYAPETFGRSGTDRMIVE